MIGTIYRINVNDEFYIGSTMKSLTERQYNHNITLKQNVRTNKLYEKCRENNINNIICILLEQKEVEDIDEIRQLEQEYIDKLQPSLNSQIAYTGLSQKQYIKEHYNNNRQHYLDYQKNYRYNNKEKVNKNCNDWYELNKDKVSKKQGEKIKCNICSSIVRKGDITRHKKTMKCRKVNE